MEYEVYHHLPRMCPTLFTSTTVAVAKGTSIHPTYLAMDRDDIYVP